ncbi:DsbA family protein [Cytophaga hutchinsonii]|uniref:Protein-disulfide isomerase n=1 Tax=Cytophaga hutchinsonii (strain ATCC 33406 / DSM 1761 / CIP 103989 / NBRC 15051 / NCIMB 9469 / D465) TaxID=269798 RepID=A0A6N4SX72_CYTH3|nr:DsbA family protein [Cytophaga hutchinsonii]ABG60873.1 protein-disulfide isomerase [Cytophaga hutchinsonii ATCC 33406]
MNNIKFYIILLAILFTGSGSTCVQKQKDSEKMKLLYVYDPLCGWCYGFGPVVEKIEKNYKGTVDVEIISGGMVMGNRIAPIGNMSEYILDAIPRLQRMTGIEFGQPYITLLKEGSYVTSSEKPSIALCVYKSFTAERAVEYGHAIQTSFYKEGKDLNQDVLYADLATSYGIDRAAFLKRMKDSVYFNQAHEEFKRAAALGVTGFPTLLLKQENGYTALTEGYATYESIEKQLQKHVKAAGTK